MHVLTENEVRNLAARTEPGGRFTVPPGALLTPLARDYLRGRRIEILETPADSKSSAKSAASDEALVEAVAAEVVRALKPGGERGADGPDRVPELRPIERERERERERGGTQAGASNRAVVWAIGGDRPGILAAVAELLGRHKVNILEISQTILSGVFAMVMVVDLSSTDRAFGELKAELESVGSTLGINLSAQRDEIFQYMHRV